MVDEIGKVDFELCDGFVHRLLDRPATRFSAHEQPHDLCSAIQTLVVKVHVQTSKMETARGQTHNGRGSHV